MSRYIHLNPVKAAMVRELLACEYSSYRDYVDGSGNKHEAGLTLDTSRILGSFHGNSRER